MSWFLANQRDLPGTLTYETRRVGLHLYYQHRPGLKCSTGKPNAFLPRGIDVRAEGGYAISWFAAGCACLDHRQPEPWPARLIEPEPPRVVSNDTALSPVQSGQFSRSRADGLIARLLDNVSRAPDGSKHLVSALRPHDRRCHPPSRYQRSRCNTPPGGCAETQPLRREGLARCSAQNPRRTGARQGQSAAADRAAIQ